MKRNFKGLCLVVFFSFIATVLSAQYWTYSAFGSNSFNEMIPGFYPNPIYVCGTYERNAPDGDGVTKDFSFYRLNHSGQVIGYNVYGENSIDEQCNFMCRDENGDFLLGGVTTNESSKRIVLVKIDENGTFDTSIFINSDPGEEDDPIVGDPLPDVDDGYIYLIVGTATKNGNKSIFSLTVSKGLEYVNNIHHVHDSKDEINQEAFDLVKAELPNKFVLVGSSDERQYIRYCVGTQLNLIDTMTLDTGKLYSVVRSPEEGLIFYACGYSNSANNRKICLIKFQILNDTIGIIWTRTLFNPTGSYAVGNEVFIHPDGGYVYVTGTKFVFFPQQKKYPMFAGYSTTGDSVYYSDYSNLPNAESNSIFFNGFDMSVYLAGSIGNDAILIKTVLGIPESITNPKPVSGFNSGNDRMTDILCVTVKYDKSYQTATVNFNITNDTKCSIIIYDVTGSRIKAAEELFFKQGEHLFSLETENFVPGIYFVSIYTDEGIATGKFSILE